MPDASNLEGELVVIKEITAERMIFEIHSEMYNTNKLFAVRATAHEYDDQASLQYYELPLKELRNG